MRVYTSSQIRKIEENAAEGGYSFVRMMENAGAGCAKKICSAVEVGGKNAAIVCGKGKNGGDGFVIARKLSEAGAFVTVILASEVKNTGDAAEMLSLLDSYPVKCLSRDNAREVLARADIIVDAVFGFGFRGEPDEATAALLKLMSEAMGTKFAVDLPSGAECDTAAVNGECFKADFTLAITSLKPAHVLLPSAQYCGNTETVKIGIPDSAFEAVADAGFFTLPKEKAKLKLPERAADSNKGDYGKALSICGSKCFAGAAVLAANAAVRSGAGLVAAAFPESAYAAIASKLTEPVLLPLPSDEAGCFSTSAIPALREEIKKSDAVLFGCGVGKAFGTAECLETVINESDCQLILDADGINLLVGNIDVLKAASGRAVLTPHPGEAARLLGLTIPQVQANRIAVARAFAAKYGVVFVLKGANTVVSDGERTYINQTGNPGMAKGGSGDLLSGILLGLLSSGISLFEAAVFAVYLHGKAGDIAAKNISMTGMTPSNMLEILPGLLSQFE